MKLYQLTLDGNKITKEWHFEGGRRVFYLSLVDTGLIDIPEWILDFKNLTELNLSDNKIRYIPEWLKDLKNLKILSLFDNPLDSSITKEAMSKLNLSLEVIGI